MSSTEGVRPSRRRWLMTAGVILVIVLALAYAAGSAYAYSQFAFAVEAKCPASEGAAEDPTAFTASTILNGVRHDVDTTPYLMPAPQSVSFAARDDPRVTIAGWWEPADRLDAPTVVVVHGSRGCRRNGGNLLVAGMLHRHGVAVLLIDMRNHGDSTVTDGHFSAGNDEYRDVLGAFDWLRGQGVPGRRIGLFGFSGGAIAATIAFGEEPGVAALWSDTSYTEAREAIRDGAAASGFPTFLDAGAVVAGRILGGEDITAKSPLSAMAKLSGRPIALTQGALDAMLNPAYLGKLADAARGAGGAPEVWQVADAGHTQAHFLHPAEYERRLAEFFGRTLGAPPG